MSLTFTKDDLLLPAIILSAVQTELATESRPDPVGDVVTGAARTVETYTARYTIDQDWAARLFRAIAHNEIFALIGQRTQQHKDEADSAMKELRDIRDGKFPDLAVAEEAPATTPVQTGAWGSQTKFKAR